MFMREVYEHKPFVPGGVLVLNGPTHNLVVYLAELSSNGGRVLYATVQGGTYEGPAIGSFGGVKRGNRIYGGLTPARPRQRRSQLRPLLEEPGLQRPDRGPG